MEIDTVKRNQSQVLRSIDKCNDSNLLYSWYVSHSGNPDDIYKTDFIFPLMNYLLIDIIEAVVGEKDLRSLFDMPKNIDMNQSSDFFTLVSTFESVKSTKNFKKIIGSKQVQERLQSGFSYDSSCSDFSKLIYYPVIPSNDKEIIYIATCNHLCVFKTDYNQTLRESLQRQMSLNKVEISPKVSTKTLQRIKFGDIFLHKTPPTTPFLISFDKTIRHGNRPDVLCFKKRDVYIRKISPVLTLSQPIVYPNIYLDGITEDQLHEEVNKAVDLWTDSTIFFSSKSARSNKKYYQNVIKGRDMFLDLRKYISFNFKEPILLFRGIMFLDDDNINYKIGNRIHISKLEPRTKYKRETSWTWNYHIAGTFASGTNSSDYDMLWPKQTSYVFAGIFSPDDILFPVYAFSTKLDYQQEVIIKGGLDKYVHVVSKIIQTPETKEVPSVILEEIPQSGPLYKKGR